MIRGTALALTVLTGFSGLVYEVAWQKALAILLGSHSEATAAVLGIFLGGLSLGYLLFGSVVSRVVQAAELTGRPPRLLLLYGAVEGSIGAWALLFPLLFAGVTALSHALHPGSDALAFALDVILTALLIGPPTIMMGATIPILTQGLARGLHDATRFHAFVYGFNTAGAFAGALAAGFWLVPLLGIPGTLRWMGALNLGAGVIFALLGLRARALQPTQPESPGEAPRGFAFYAAVAVLLGFALMSIQTVLIRIGGLAFGASHFTFAMVVAVFVLCIALGSLAVSAFDRVPRAVLPTCVWLLAALLYGLYSALPDAPYYVHVLRTFFRDVDASFYPYYLAGFLGILGVLFLPVGLGGATLPLLFDHLRREVGELGRVAGRIYSWNTVGNLLGALLGGYALLFWLDLHHVYRLGVGAVVLAALILTVRIYGVTRPALGVAVLSLLALVLLPAWEPLRLASGSFRVRQASGASYHGAGEFFALHGIDQIPFYDDDPTTSVAVKERPDPRGKVTRSIITNGKSDGSLGADYPTMALAALLPCLIADECRHTFVVGYGTGVTAGELAELDSVETVAVAEISRGVIEAAGFFEHGNRQASGSPKVRIVRSDAYRALLRSTGPFDVIASEPSNPWVTGVEMLYSREFLEAARARLAPGGVYAQWFHTYETDTETIELVLRTYASVFEHVTVWYTVGPDLILLGRRAADRIDDLDRIERRMQRKDFAAGLRRSGIQTLPGLLAHELLPLGVVNAAEFEGDVHTLLHPVLSHSAARAFFRGQQALLPLTARPRAARVGADQSLLRGHAERRGRALSAEERDAVAGQLCPQRALECASFLARWRFDSPGASELEAWLARLRRAPEFAESLSPERLDLLVAFHGDGSAVPAHGAEGAAQATRLFAEHYHHAVPFRREALRALWNKCRDTGSRCALGQAEAKELLGRLGATDDGAR
jgi:spermidine synthase